MKGFMSHCMSLLMALSCHADARLSWQLSGSKRSLRFDGVVVVNRPKQTLDSRLSELGLAEAFPVT
jgi:hypothetical protein